MRTFDVTPLYRSTVGFDRLFEMLDTSIRPDWPPYNIERKSEDEYAISMAIAGFGSEDIELTQTGTQLLIRGQKATEAEGQQMLHQGIAARAFQQTFNLAEHVKVVSADLENGLLSIGLIREVPEQMKPRKIEIGTSGPKLSHGNSVSQQAAKPEQDAKLQQRKTA